MTALALKKPTGWTAANAYGQMASMIEEGRDQTAEVVPLHQFMEHEEWGDFYVRPRQRLVFKVADNAISKRPLAEGLGKVRLTADNCLEAEGNPLFFRTLGLSMAHCIEVDEDGLGCTYDEAADWDYLLLGENKYARAIANYDPDGKDPLTLVFIMGRGSSKTTYLSAGISAWMTYRILGTPDPHAMFGLQNLKPLRVQNVATSSTQAGEFFDSYRTMIEKVKWFEGKHEPPGAGLVKFGRHLYAEKSSSSSKSTRGRDTVVYVHDEIAFADKTAGPRSDRKLYDAIRKAVKTRAKGKGLIVVVSSPAEADGVLFELITQAEAGTLPNSIVIQAATWEMIPGQTKEDYASEYRQDEDVAEMEYGAQFYTGSSNLLPNVAARFGDMARIYAGLTRRDHTDLETPAGPFLWLPNRDKEEDALYLKRQRKYPRVLHVDTSEGGDRLVVAMTHIRDRRVLLELMRAWPREVSYSRELFPFLRALHARAPIDKITFDQMDSLQLIQDLNDMGITAEKTAFTQQYNDLIARNFKTLVTEGLLGLYPVEKTLYAGLDRVLDRDDWAEDDARWPQVSMAILQREMVAAKKVIKGQYIAAEAPTAGPVQTDDALDAAMAATYQAIQLYGGLGAFMTFPGNPGAIASTDPLPQDLAAPSGNLPGERDVLCPHHKGWVTVSTEERIVPCPYCKNLIQTKL